MGSYSHDAINAHLGPCPDQGYLIRQKGHILVLFFPPPRATQAAVATTPLLWRVDISGVTMFAASRLFIYAAPLPNMRKSNVLVRYRVVRPSGPNAAAKTRVAPCRSASLPTNGRFPHHFNARVSQVLCHATEATKTYRNAAVRP